MSEAEIFSMVECEGAVEVFEDRKLHRITADISIFIKMRRELVKLLGPECAGEILAEHYDEIVGEVRRRLEKLKDGEVRWEVCEFTPRPTHRNVNPRRAEAYLPIRAVCHAGEPLPGDIGAAALARMAKELSLQLRLIFGDDSRGQGRGVSSPQ